MHFHDRARQTLLETSRTFFIPIMRLPEGLQEAVAGAYLCMRAIDEIEDDPILPSETKGKLLRSIASNLDTGQVDKIKKDLMAYQTRLPAVSLSFCEWLALVPDSVLPLIRKSVSTMANGMANWADREWSIESEEDLDQYTFYVAGLVGVMLSDLWNWYDQTSTDKEQAIGFGRGLQAVNMLRNRSEDLSRGVDYYPNGWGIDEMMAYAKKNLALADRYLERIKTRPIYEFCKIPLALAHSTLQAIEEGRNKLSREEVVQLADQIIMGSSV